MMTFTVTHGQPDAAEIALLAVVLCKALAGPGASASRPARPAPAPWWRAGNASYPPSLEVAPATGCPWRSSGY
jgi:hypothetical protein